MWRALFNGTCCERCVRGTSLSVPPSFMLESSAAVDGGDAEIAAQIVEGYPGGGRHGTIADVAMIASVHQSASCQVKIRIKR